MAKFLAKKYLRSIVPVDQAGEDVLHKLPPAEIFQVEIKRPRNIKFHRKFFALMNIVYENVDEERYPSLDDFVGAVKISTGHRTRIELPNGTIGFIPKSISFAKMTQQEFNEFYDRTVDMICKHFLPGVQDESLRAEVENMVGISHV